MVAGLLHLMEQIVGRLQLGHEHGLAHNRFDGPAQRGIVEDRRTHGILHVCDAEQVVYVIANHRNARIAGTRAQFEEVLQRVVLFNADHVGARHHDLAREGIG